jgi:hypothetical protein
MSVYGVNRLKPQVKAVVMWDLESRNSRRDRPAQQDRDTHPTLALLLSTR